MTMTKSECVMSVRGWRIYIGDAGEEGGLSKREFHRLAHVATRKLGLHRKSRGAGRMQAGDLDVKEEEGEEQGCRG